MRLSRAAQLIESQAIHLTSPDPVVRETAREAVRHVLVTYRDQHTPDPRDTSQDTPERTAARRAALLHSAA
jgi:hypothetical protein